MKTSAIMKQWRPAVVILSLMLASSARGQVVPWGLERRRPGQTLLRGRSEESTFEEVIINEKGTGGYFATVTVGSPGQDLVMQLDTASSDTWVPYTGAPICEGLTSGCPMGTFDPHASKTFKEVTRDQFEVSYVDQSYSSGDYFADSFEIGGAVVQNLTMGLGLKTNIPYGLVGVGYPASEGALTTRGLVAYPNLPISMQEEGLINSVAYSLWLNDLDANTGTILFGGVDTKKYIGPLIKIDVIPDEGIESYTHFLVSLTSLEATSPTGTDILTSPEGPVEVVLDSGSTLTYLPNDMASKVWKEVGAEYQDIFGMAVLPCSHGSHPGYFSFGFGGSNGPRINVTMDELVVDLTNGAPPRFTSGPYDGELVCEFGVQNYSSGPFVLGDTFLRSAYVVYDLENHEIALAATDFNSTKSEIVAFRSKGASIPFATAAGEDDGGANAALPTSTTLAAAEGFQDLDDADSDSAATSLMIVVGRGLLALFVSTATMAVVGW